jgi:hypothetical protein
MNKEVSMAANNLQQYDHESEFVLVEQDKTDLDGADTSCVGDECKITKPFDPSKIRVESKNITTDVLIKRLRNDEINLQPDFQRLAGIWKDETQSRLIESMLIRIPLPAFYMDATDDNKWLVVDGLQRLTTLKRFVVDKTLALCGLEFLSEELSGKKYHELPRAFQRRIEETEIVIYLIQPGTPANVKFDIFRRINTGGEPLSAQEIRHALNQGKIIKILERLAKSEEFKRATAGGVSAKRMDDRECVLRFFSFMLNEPATYNTNNFDAFLNESMAQLNRMSDDELNVLCGKFSGTMQTVSRLFGNDAFRKRYHESSARHPINKALFESWAVNLGRLSSEQTKQLITKKADLRKQFIRLMNEKDFDLAVSQGTGSISRVRLRFKKIEELIREVLA